MEFQAEILFYSPSVGNKILLNKYGSNNNIVKNIKFFIQDSKNKSYES